MPDGFLMPQAAYFTQNPQWVRFVIFVFLAESVDF